MIPVLLALGSMFCAAMNDLVFKLFSGKSRPIGLYMAIIGLVWTLVFLVRGGGWTTSFLDLNPRVLILGLLAGALSVTANILLISGMAKTEVGVCAAVYRMNLVPAALMSFILLGESATFGKLLGIVFAVAAVILFFSPNVKGRRQAKMGLAGVWIVILAALFRGGMGVAYKYGMTAAVNVDVFLMINGVMWVLGGLLFNFFEKRRGLSPAMIRSIVSYGMMSGLLVCGIVLFMALALKAGDATVVLPVAQLSFAVTGVAGILFLGDSFNRRKASGFGLAVLCVLIMTLE